MSRTTVRSTLMLFLMALSALRAGAGDIYDITDYGAQVGGEFDCTPALQAAIDAAHEKGGSVYVPAGEWLVAGNLYLKAGVALTGSNQAPMSIAPRKGSILLATAGRDDEEAPPFIHMTHSSTVQGITVYYPEQRPDDIRPYPWSFQLEGNDQTVENVTLINSYNGIRTGPGGNVRHRIESVFGCVLRRGILVDTCTDIGRVENVQWHCHWWSDPDYGGDWAPVYDFMCENLEAFIFARTDWEYITNNFVYPARIGFHFIASEHGTSNGHMTACGADSTNVAVQVDAIQFMGYVVTGGQFASFVGENPAQVRIASGCDGNMRFVNCNFWGRSDHNAMLEGTGTTSFSDCYFSNWTQAAGGLPLIEARAGRLQVQNSSFASAHPAVRLGPGVAHGIVRGNNGPYGVQVLDESPRSIVTDNEPDPIQWTEAARRCFRLDVGAKGDERYLVDWQGPEPAGEWDDGGTKRWSTGCSAILLPILPDTQYALTIDLHTPPYATGDGAGIYLGKQRLATLKPGTQCHTAEFLSDDADTFRLELRPQAWHPIDVLPNTDDKRALGVAVRSITLRAKGTAEASDVFDANTGAYIRE